MGVTGLLSLMLTVILCLLHLFGWGVVFVAIFIVLLPVVKTLVEIWNKENCIDLDDLKDVIFTEDKEEEYLVSFDN